MATSGSTLFNLDFTDIAEEAWERAGRGMRSGYDLRTARRSMNLLMIEWQNRGVNLWTIEEGVVPLLTGVLNYNLPADTVDIMDQVVRTGTGQNQQDVSITRIDVNTYATIPNKLVEGRPIQVWVDRQRDNPQINVWPVPNNDSYSFQYWRMRRIQDAGDGVENPDMPYRFLPCLVAGLAYYLCMKEPELRPNAQILKADYDEQFRLATEQDREKTPFRAVPHMRLRY